MNKIILLSLALTQSAIAEKIPSGIWQQIDSNAGACGHCQITTNAVTPDILSISSNNGWVGYASYNSQQDKYMGVMQWESGKGGAYENILLSIDIKYDGNMAYLEAKSSIGNFSVRYLRN
jgi:hypothetical protein